MTEQEQQGEFDVFLCHNSLDKPEVREIANQLRARGILPWLDEWELRPGFPWQVLLEQQIANIKSAAVFVGSSGLGPWQEQELRGFLSEFVNRNCPVIPVLLSNAPQQPKIPIFLKAMTWVDFRRADSEPINHLIWGITGVKPEQGDNKETSGLSDISRDSVENASPLSAVQKVKCTSLQHRLDSLVADYAAASMQLVSTLSAVDRNILQRQIDSISRDMDEVERELKSLGCA